MLRQIWIPVQMRIRDYLIYLAITLGCFVCGLLLEAYIMGSTAEMDIWMPIASLLIGLELIFLIITDGMVSLGIYMRMAVRMSGSRKVFLLGFVLERFLLVGAAGLLVLALLYGVELPFCRMLREGVPMILADCYQSSIWYIVPILLALFLCGVLSSMLVIRFGNVVKVVMWLLWMLAVVGVPQLLGAAQRYPGSAAGKIGAYLLALPSNMSTAQIWGGIGLIAAAMTAAAILLG